MYRLVVRDESGNELLNIVLPLLGLVAVIVVFIGPAILAVGAMLLAGRRVFISIDRESDD
jgi:hypothetical protein